MDNFESKQILDQLELQNNQLKQLLEEVRAVKTNIDDLYSKLDHLHISTEQ